MIPRVPRAPHDSPNLAPTRLPPASGTVAALMARQAGLHGSVTESMGLFIRKCGLPCSPGWTPPAWSSVSLHYLRAPRRRTLSCTMCACLDVALGDRYLRVMPWSPAPHIARQASRSKRSGVFPLSHLDSEYPGVLRR